MKAKSKLEQFSKSTIEITRVI